MTKCDICGGEGFRELKGLIMCISCYRLNLNERFSKTSKFIKRDEIQTKTHKY